MNYEQISTELSKLQDAIQDESLDFEAIQAHQQALFNATYQGHKPYFRILDTCRLENGGILPPRVLHKAGNETSLNSNHEPATDNPSDLSGTPDTFQTYIAFIPSAGAASRYFAPFSDLNQALDPIDTAAAQTALETLQQQGAKHWPLPAQLAALVGEPESIAQLSPQQVEEIKSLLEQPKALMPCVLDGCTFFNMKQHEHRHLPQLLGEVFVIPPGLEDEFKRQALANSGQGNKTLQTVFLEQGPQLSSIRFQPDCTPYVDDEGNISPVPAGHGSLAQLFPEVGKHFPKATGVWIRNVDNISGNSSAFVSVSEQFLKVHAYILNELKKIRSALGENSLEQAATVAQALWAYINPEAEALTKEADPTKVLLALQTKLFHTPKELLSTTSPSASVQDLLNCYNRPFNLLGQVPNTGKDVGGTPCFIEQAHSHQPPDSRLATKQSGIKRQVVCLEVPHATPEDKETFLHDPELATHFNPVFVAAEITSDPKYYMKRNQDFWLIAEKTFKGKPVIYYETVLYELLGNTLLANALFVEIPRVVFNPHKVPKDGENKHLHDWLK